MMRFWSLAKWQVLCIKLPKPSIAFQLFFQGRIIATRERASASAGVAPPCQGRARSPKGDGRRDIAREFAVASRSPSPGQRTRGQCRRAARGESVADRTCQQTAPSRHFQKRFGVIDCKGTHGIDPANDPAIPTLRTTWTAVNLVRPAKGSGRLAAGPRRVPQWT